MRETYLEKEGLPIRGCTTSKPASPTTRPLQQDSQTPPPSFILPRTRPPLQLLEHSSPNSPAGPQPKCLLRETSSDHPSHSICRPCGTENVAEIVPTCLHLSTRDYFLKKKKSFQFSKTALHSARHHDWDRSWPQMLHTDPGLLQGGHSGAKAEPRGWVCVSCVKFLHKMYLKCFLSGGLSTEKWLTQHMVIMDRGNG